MSKKGPEEWLKLLAESNDAEHLRSKLSPEKAKALRERFGIETANQGTARRADGSKKK